jgi:selenocysteine lyase/cysteine desulfurase
MGAGMSDRLKEIGERFEDYAEPAKHDIAHLLALLYVMKSENEKLREHVRQLTEHLERALRHLPLLIYSPKLLEVVFSEVNLAPSVIGLA